MTKLEFSRRIFSLFLQMTRMSWNCPWVLNSSCIGYNTNDHFHIAGESERGKRVSNQNWLGFVPHSNEVDTRYKIFPWLPFHNKKRSLLFKSHVAYLYAAFCPLYFTKSLQASIHQRDIHFLLQRRGETSDNVCYSLSSFSFPYIYEERVREGEKTCHPGLTWKMGTPCKIRTGKTCTCQKGKRYKKVNRTT